MNIIENVNKLEDYLINESEISLIDIQKISTYLTSIREEAINYTQQVSTRSFNELEMLAEDLECVKMWLDDKKAPKTDSDGNEYSVVGRIQCLLNVC